MTGFIEKALLLAAVSLVGACFASPERGEVLTLIGLSAIAAAMLAGMWRT